MKESQIQRAILDWLAAKHILAFRMNSGALRNPAGKPITFGVPGMADILAFPHVNLRVLCSAFEGKWHQAEIVQPTWIECKAPTERQSALQASFEAQVVGEGHRYVLARSVSDVEAALL